jgi:mannose-1-phosphate guanylyltransferase/mannose-6-phosphate isomerase
MTQIQPVILSGGSGSRLWPASRSMYPKQLLPMVGEKTMLQSTVARIEGLSKVAPSLIAICNEAHRFLVAEQIAETGVAADVILEPEGRNTAPAIALAALHAMRTADEAPLLLVLPADHVIAQPSVFRAAVTLAATAAAEGALVTFGVVPTAPHTGYGYIRAKRGGAGAVRIDAFVEKPDLETARQYTESGEYFWNSGMFLFRADRYLEELGKHAPAMLAACEAAMAGARVETDFLRPDPARFLESPSDSVDYAIMEKTDAAMVVPLDAGWNDVGSWEAIFEVRDKDADGNVVDGDTLAVDSRHNIISSESRLVAAVGVEDLAIVETKDAVLVASKRRCQDVKKLVDRLNAERREETSLHRQVFRPWGSYDSLENQPGFQVKRLIVQPGAVLSLQLHHHRAEHWVVVQGSARITLDDEEFDLGVNESTYIPIGAKHRIANVTDEPVHIIEVQCGDYLGEDDIVRFEDNYGREGTNT